MPNDVWSALAKGCLGFAHSRVGDMTGTTFNDTRSLVTSLFDHSPLGTAKTRLYQLKRHIDSLSAAAQPVIDAVKPEVAKAKLAVGNMARELGTAPFSPEAAGRAATELAYVMIALDTALDVVAKKIAEPEPGEAARRDLENQIRGIREPWIAPFRGMAAGASAGFDALCNTVLGVEYAGTKFADLLIWSREQKKLTLTLPAAGARSIGELSFDGASVEAFFSYKDTAKVGVVLRTRLKAGLRGDKLLAKIIPGEKPTADSESIAITLDTKDGLTFGDGPNRTLVLPVRFSLPGVELRELAIALPEGQDGRIDIMATVAGNLGDVVGVVAEGFGVSLKWKGDHGAALTAEVKPPTAAGLRIKAGVINGGGYLRYNEAAKEYGGVLDLQFTKIGITAIGLIVPDPFSMVIVIGVHFLPKIELSFGFTLNGLGGILAINRGLSSDELRKGVRDGAVNQLLFPDDPIAAAPTILTRLGKIFPPQPGAFVVGPIAELGWGSQAGFVKAKVGIILALPDPKIVILGAVQIGVPSADAPPDLRIVDLRIEIAAEFTPDYVFIGGSLANSKLAGLTVSGDLGMLIRWNGGAAFALSVGGFFPKFTPPPELADMRRLALELSPPVDFLKVRAEAYFAITANSVQFGGRVTITAKLGPVSGKAWVGLDALFQWSPRFYFIFLVDAGIEIRAFGEAVAGVSFRGELSGMKPWHLEGHASITILLWDVDVDIRPIEWGERDLSTAPALSPLDVVTEALMAKTAWTPQLPAGTDTLARFREDDAPLLVHPLGALEVKQLRVPLETTIDRIGSSPVTARRVHLAEPKIGALAAQAVSHATEQFAPGHFLKMTDDEQASRAHFESFPCGMKVAASDGVVSGPPSSVKYQWETVYPHEEFEKHAPLWNLGALGTVALRSNAVSSGARGRGNPYLPPLPVPAAEALALGDIGRVRIRRRSDLTAIADLGMTMTTAAAAVRVRELTAQHGADLQMVTAGTER